MFLGVTSRVFGLALVISFIWYMFVVSFKGIVSDKGGEGGGRFFLVFVFESVLGVDLARVRGRGY